MQPLVGRQIPSLPKELVEMGCDCRQKDLMKSMPRDIPTKHPKSTGSENIGPGRADFGSVGMGEVGSLVATTLEFNEKIRPCEQAESELGREVGNGNWGRTLSGA